MSSAAPQPPPIDEEEVRARQAMRRHLRKGGMVLAWLGLMVALMLGSLQAAAAYGPRPAVLWTPVALYALLLVRFIRRRSPAMAAFCLLCAWATVRLLGQLTRLRAAV